MLRAGRDAEEQSHCIGSVDRDETVTADKLEQRRYSVYPVTITRLLSLLG